MVLNRSSVRRVENAARGFLESFRLRNGEMHYYDPVEAGSQLFVFSLDLVISDEGNEPDEPPFLIARRQAVDPATVLARFESGDISKSFIDLDALLAYVQEPRDRDEEPV